MQCRELTRTGVTGDRKNWTKWNYSIYKVLCRAKFKLNKRLVKTLAKLEKPYLQLKSKLFTKKNCFRIFSKEVVFFQRELREYRQRNEALNVDLKRKEKQIKDFQTRLDSEGCKYHFSKLLSLLLFFNL